MALVHTFTSFTGRLSRRGFWFGIGSLLAVGSLASASVTPNILSDDPFGALIRHLGEMGPKEVAIYLAMLYPAMAIVIKRLHDRNKSGLFAALFFAPALIKAVTALVPALAGIAGTLMWGVDGLTAWLGAVGTWFFIELGLYGPKDPNRYGPDPRA